MEGLRGAPELLLLVLLSLAKGSLSGPAIRTVPVPEGGAVTLICDVSKPVSFHEPVLWTVTQRGVDHTVVTRREDGRVVKGADDPQNRFSLLDDSSLLIWSVKPGDAGLYSCNRQPVADLQVTTVIISVPVGQHLVLNCSDPPPAQGTSVQWTYRRDREGDTQATDVTRKILNTKQKKYHVYSSGALYIHDVELDDSGLYYCNSQAVAELEVLGGTGETGDTGTPARTKTSPGEHAADRAGEGGRDTGPAIRTVTVPEGGAVTLDCDESEPVSSHEPVLWTVSQRGGVDHTVVTRLEDGSVVKGADDPQNRFSLLDDSSLLILSVKPGDAGLYSCNRQPVVELQLTTGGTSPTPGAETSSGKPAPGGGGKSGDDTAVGSSLWERGKVVIPVLLGLCALALLTGAALFWCRRKRGPGTGSRDEGVSLQRASPSALGTETTQSAAGQVDIVQEEGEVHYASLGHQGKRDPRSRAQDADSSVVYSSIARGAQ